MGTLMHDVYFTLKDRSPEARQSLVDGCRKHLRGHPGELFFACGKRNELHARDVNDREFDVSLHIAFKDKAAHDAYQDSPRHHEFVAHFQPGWSRARVFDTDLDASTLS